MKESIYMCVSHGQFAVQQKLAQYCKSTRFQEHFLKKIMYSLWWLAPGAKSW